MQTIILLVAGISHIPFYKSPFPEDVHIGMTFPGKGL